MTLRVWGLQALSGWTMSFVGLCHSATAMRRRWGSAGQTQSLEKTGHCPQCLPRSQCKTQGSAHPVSPSSGLCHANRSLRLPSTRIQLLPGAAEHEREVFVASSGHLGPANSEISWEGYLFKVKSMTLPSLAGLGGCGLKEQPQPLRDLAFHPPCQPCPSLAPLELSERLQLHPNSRSLRGDFGMGLSRCGPPSTQGFGPWKGTLHLMGKGLVAVPALASPESTDTQIRLGLEFWKPTSSGLSIPWEPTSSISSTFGPNDSPSSRCMEL